MKKHVIFLLALMLAIPAMAQDYKVGDIAVSNTWIKEGPPRAPTLAGYVTFENTGAADDRLIAIESDGVEKVELHNSVVTEGIARMAPMEGGLLLPAGQSVTLGEVGTHAMFINPPKPYRDGDEIAATLVLEKAGRVNVVFTVERRRADSDGMSMDMNTSSGASTNGQ